MAVSHKIYINYIYRYRLKKSVTSVTYVTNQSDQWSKRNTFIYICYRISYNCYKHDLTWYKRGDTMTEIELLIEYAELSGFHLSINGDNLSVGNGSNLPYHLKRLLTIYKTDILDVLKIREVIHY